MTKKLVKKGRFEAGSVEDLFNIISKLRGEGGCDWDRKQTPTTMWKCLAEEMFELEEAIAKKDMDNICEELGDVLFQLLFIIHIFNEKGDFSFSDIISQVAQKMIRRHPHVYGAASNAGLKDLDRQWEQIKSEEKKEKNQQKRSALDNVPKGMPALMRAFKVSKSAVKEGFEWDSLQEVLETAKGEIQEFESALASRNSAEMNMEFGDILFSMVNVGRFANVHPETALSDATTKFETRFRQMESDLKKADRRLVDLSKDEKEKFWQAAKKVCKD